MITSEDIVSTLVRVELHFSEFLILFENDTISETRALLVLVDIDFVVKCVSFVCWHKVYLLLMVAREPSSLVPLLIKLIITHHVFFRKLNKLNEI